MRALVLLAVLVAAPAVATEPQLVLDATVAWDEPRDDFGGYSGLVVLDGGTRLVTVSDRGTWATADIARKDGHITDVTLTDAGPLLGIAGAPLDGVDIDAEGLAMDARGRAYVSFEAFHRIRRHDWIGEPATGVASHADFPDLQNNSGLEALAVDAEGTLYAIPERSGRLTRPFPVYRLRDGAWDKTLSLPRAGEFLVTDADFGPEGALYLLERDFGWLRGFATRIRRFRLTEAGFDAGETLLETEFGALDNMEGISVWRDAAGDTRITLISDDNFFLLQQTLLVEYVLHAP